MLKKLLTVLVVAFALALVGATAGWAQGLDKPCLVVALDKLDGDKVYARTVMLAAPQGEAHVGVILNRPSPFTLGALFPADKASQAVKENVYFGGPQHAMVVFGLARAAESPGIGSKEMMPGIWLIIRASTLASFIARSPNDARYFQGVVFWKPGELREEIRAGVVMVRPADRSKLFRPDTSELYQELVTPNRKPAVET